MVSSKNRNYHRNHGCNLVEIAVRPLAAWPNRMTKSAPHGHGNSMSSRVLLAETLSTKCARSTGVKFLCE